MYYTRRITILYYPMSYNRTQFLHNLNKTKRIKLFKRNNSKNKVYHFSWSALTCGGCDQMIDKYDFLLQPRQYRSNQGRSTKQYNTSMKVIKTFVLILAVLTIINLITKLI